MTDLQKNMLTGALIGAGAVLSRLPFLESAPFHTDSLHFLRGVTKTGIAHPPGYIGYCMSGRVIYYIIGNAHLAILVLNLIAIFFVGFLLYQLGLKMRGATSRSSALMTLLFLASPFPYYYSAVSLSYITECASAILLVLFCVNHLEGKKWGWWASSATLALGASLRQTVLVFLSPLWAFTMLHTYLPKFFQSSTDKGGLTSRSLKPFLVGLFIVTVLVACWMFPTFILFERQGGYSARMNQQMADAVWANSVFVAGIKGLLKNSAKTFFFLLWNLNVTILLYFFEPVRNYFRKLWSEDRKILFLLLLWILPALGFYSLIFMGPAGYLLCFLPAFYLPLAGVLYGKVFRYGIFAMLFSASLFLLPRPLPEHERTNRMMNIIILHYNAGGIEQRNSRNFQHIDSKKPRDYGDANEWY